jgi:hypothetical protein
MWSMAAPQFGTDPMKAALLFASGANTHGPLIMFERTLAEQSGVRGSRPSRIAS